MKSDLPLFSDKLTLDPFEALCRGSVFASLADDYRALLPDTVDTAPFVLNDLRLYLDTHPCDLCAHAHYRRTAKKAGVAVLEPAFDTYCPLRWTWIDGPWPWEKKTEED